MKAENKKKSGCNPSIAKDGLMICKMSYAQNMKADSNEKSGCNPSIATGFNLWINKIFSFVGFSQNRA
jgi:hypothetical protein